MDSIPQTCFPAMNQDAVNVGGRAFDRGAIHRAIAVARELCRAGMWNGQDQIIIYDPAVTFNKVFGFNQVPVTFLKSGVDYLIKKDVL